MRKIKLLLLLLVLLLTPQGIVHAELHIPDKPQYELYDPGDYIKTDTINKLILFNKKHQDMDGMQLGVAVIDTLDGEPIESLSNKIAKKWQIGHSDTNRGALLLIAINDRKFRIETSNNIRDELTDEDTKHILNSTLSDMRRADYDSAVYKIITQIDSRITPKPASKIAQLREENERKVRNFKYGLAGTVGLLGGGFAAWYARRKKDLRRRSDINHQGDDKLYPSDRLFRNTNWSKDDIFTYWAIFNANRSNYGYTDLSNKLYPSDPEFVPNDSWSPDLIDAFNEDCLKRSDYFYEGDDKLRPGDRHFIQNPSWTNERLDRYNDSSYSSLSSDAWSGGGFDGGGSSSSW
jgi:hypothetical protein